MAPKPPLTRKYANYISHSGGDFPSLTYHFPLDEVLGTNVFQTWTRIRLQLIIHSNNSNLATEEQHRHLHSSWAWGISLTSDATSPPEPNLDLHANDRSADNWRGTGFCTKDIQVVPLTNLQEDTWRAGFEWTPMQPIDLHSQQKFPAGIIVRPWLSLAPWSDLQGGRTSPEMEGYFDATMVWLERP